MQISRQTTEGSGARTLAAPPCYDHSRSAFGGSLPPGETTRITVRPEVCKFGPKGRGFFKSLHISWVGETRLGRLARWPIGSCAASRPWHGRCVALLSSRSLGHAFERVRSMGRTRRTWTWVAVIVFCAL